jgi:hypothetical protein
MTNLTRSLIGASAVALLFAASMAAAQQPLRAHGTIESFDNSTLVLKPSEGPDMNVKVADDAKIFGALPAAIADVKPGDFIAVGAMPQPDGSQKATIVTIFPESMRGIGEGFRPWDRPGSTMTNATVNSTVASVDGQVVMVKYKDGEKKIIVGPDATIRVYVPGERSELKPGSHIAIPRIEKLPDGALQTARIYVGRNGVVPQ